MLEPYGSKDDLEDIIEALEGTTAHYVLAVLVPGEAQTILLSNINPDVAEETGHNLLDYCEELAVG